MSDFPGLKVLVVEDEGSIALLIEDMLLELGCDLRASIGRLDKACIVAGTISVDFAVLDVNLAGELVFPVAEILRKRAIPFLFSTGYGGLPERFRDCLVLNKPFTIEDVRRKIRMILASKTTDHPVTGFDSNN